MGYVPCLEVNGEPLSAHFFAQSSWATYAMGYERSVVKVDKSAPLELLGPLGCGIQTGAGAVFNILNPKGGSMTDAQMAAAATSTFAPPWLNNTSS